MRKIRIHPTLFCRPAYACSTSRSFFTSDDSSHEQETEFDSLLTDEGKKFFLTMMKKHLKETEMSSNRKMARDDGASPEFDIMSNVEHVVNKGQKLIDTLQSSEIECDDVGAGVTRWKLPPDVIWMGSTNSRDLFERPTWKQLVDLCVLRMEAPITGNQGVAIGFSPGIGKTMFLNRLLIEFYRRFPSKSVLFFERDRSVFVLFNWDEGRVTHVALAKALEMIQEGSLRDKLIVLDDPSKQAHKRDHVRMGPAYFAVASAGAMEEEHFKESRKQAQLIQATMDPLTEEEAVVMLWCLFEIDEAHAKRLYKEWGGCLRHLVYAAQGGDVLAQIIMEREEEFKKVGLRPSGWKDLNLKELSSKKLNVSDHLVQHWREHPTKVQTRESRPASEYVARALHDAVNSHGRSELAEYVKGLNPILPEYWWGFETLAHECLADGGTFDLLASVPGNSTVDWAQLPLDGFAETCSEFPFNFNKSVAELFENYGMGLPDDTKEAQNKWQYADENEKEMLFKLGISAGFNIKVDVKHNIRTFAHAQTNTEHFSLNSMITTPVYGVDDIQRAIREWSDTATQSPRYFKPTTSRFPGMYQCTHTPIYKLYTHAHLQALTASLSFPSLPNQRYFGHHYWCSRYMPAYRK